MSFEEAGPSLPDRSHVEPRFQVREASRQRRSAARAAPHDRQKRSGPPRRQQHLAQMNWLLAAFILLVGVAPAAARPFSIWPFNQGLLGPGEPVAEGPPQRPHPAVARVAAPGRGSISYGSGTLVAVNEKHGLVVTNWHVVNEAVGPVIITFPDGFRSTGTVQKVNRDWDLAAIALWRPPVEPVTVATTSPQPGEVLTIAGYGAGNYRSASGRCTQYVAPGQNLPFEMVELAASARQGDSGGPIFNGRGELAGVLFGAGGGRTAGSYCGRVHWFLRDVVPDRRQQPANAAQIAAAPVEVEDSLPLAAVQTKPPALRQRFVAARAPIPAAMPSASPAGPSVANRSAQPAQAPAAVRKGPEAAGSTQQLGWEDIAGINFFDQARTLLAIVGSLALLMQVLRLLGA